MQFNKKYLISKIRSLRLFVNIVTICYNLSNRYYIDFCMQKNAFDITDWKININNDITEFFNEETFHKKNIEILWDEIFDVIYKGAWVEIREAKEELYKMEMSYIIAKDAHRKQYRESWERYFEHVREVAHIVLRELPNPSLKKVIIAILHDIVEDTDVDYHTIKNLFWSEIADWVLKISKNDFSFYIENIKDRNLRNDARFIYWKKSRWGELSTEELKKLKHINSVLKWIRNVDYFWHMKDLDNDTLDVKFADRIHNLRTQWSCSKDKIIRKIKETEEYFMDLAKRRNYKAYELMLVEINKLKIEYCIIK